MKYIFNSIFKKSISITVALMMISSLFVLAIPMAMAETPHSTMSVIPTTTTILENETITISIAIDNTTAVAGGMATLSFDPTIVNISSVDFSNYFGAVSYNISDTEGIIRMAAARADAIGEYNAIFVNITFQSIAQGSTDLILSNTQVNCVNGLMATANSNDGSISVIAPPPIAISISPDTSILNVSALQQFTATLYPEDANQQVTWHVDNATVGVIDSNGLFIANEMGIVNVIASSDADSTLTATAFVIVTVPLIEEEITPIIDIDANIPEFIAINETNISEITITTVTDVSNVTISVQQFTEVPDVVESPNESYQYFYIDTNIESEDIAEVTILFNVSKSWIDANNIDKYTIVFNRFNTTTNVWDALPTELVSECDQYVTYSATIPHFSIFAITGNLLEEPTSISISPDSLITNICISQQFTATVYPIGANQQVVWTTDNSTLGIIDANGIFAPLAEGIVNVTATSVVNESIVGTATITIRPNPISISISQESLVLNINETHQFTSEILPNNTDQQVTWSVNNASVGTISENGEFTAISQGLVIVTVRSVRNEALYTTATVEVFARLRGDLNGDGQLDSGDATLSLRMGIGEIPIDIARGDLNGNGVIDSGDATLILRGGIV